MYKRTFVFCFLFFLTISSGIYSQIKQDYTNSIFSIPFPVPQIGLTKTQILVHPCGPDTINFTITPPDSVRILTVKLFWTKNLNPWDSLSMTNVGGNNWRGIIYISSPGTYKYYMKTKDSLNRIQHTSKSIDILN